MYGYFDAPVCQLSDNWEDMFFQQVQRDQEKTNLTTPCELNEDSNDDEVKGFLQYENFPRIRAAISAMKNELAKVMDNLHDRLKD